MTLAEQIAGMLEDLGINEGGNPAVKDALTFYANEVNWVPGGSALDPTPPAVALDKGEMARRALGMNKPNKPVAATAKPVKGAKPKSAKPKPKPKTKTNPESDKPKRPPVDMVTSICKGCGRKEIIPLMLTLNKITADGGVDADYRCPKCVKSRKL